MAEVWLVRHAETEWSVNGRHTGRTDIPLTSAGEAAARALAPRLVAHRFARVLVSPLGRAQATAELAGVGDAAEVREELREWDYGDYEGITTPDIRRDRPDWWLWRDGAPGGEAPADVAARCDRLVAELAESAGRDGDGDVLCVAHGHILRALGARWLEQPVELGGHLVLSTGSVSRLGWERDVRAFVVWNG
jgi:broad specificity phosphatase PhoE